MITGLIIGAIFGAGLFLSGLANPDKIIGTLRLKDFHAMRVIIVFVLVGMLGVWVLGLMGLAHGSVKPAFLWPGLVGGLLIGAGFGLTGYCPGTGLACAAAGRFDALITVAGMLGGAFVFILAQPYIVGPMESVLAYGKVTLPEITGTNAALWVLPIVAVGGGLLYVTRPRSPRQETSPAEPPAEQ